MCSCSSFKPLAKPYRYEAKVSFILAAESLDEARDMQKQIVELVRRHTNERVTRVSGSMLDLKHRADLDGSLRA